MRTPELLPCPWCGRVPVWQAGAVMCLPCHITLDTMWFEGSKTATIRAWNYRPGQHGRDVASSKGET